MFAWLIAFVLLMVALLSIPLRISVVADPAARPRYRMRFSWLFGLVRAPLNPSASRKNTVERRRASSSRKAKRRWTFRQTMAFVRAWGGATRALEALRALIASLRPQVQSLRVDLGLDDPADTGRAFALLAPLSAWLAYRYGEVVLAPSFAEPAWSMDGRAHLTIVPLQTLGILLRYLLSFRTLRAFQVAQRSA